MIGGAAYAYKWVSLQLGGGPDWKALVRARKRGWEPVPLAEQPDPVPNPLDMTAEQLSRFKLFRMPLDKHAAMIAEREMLNAALAKELVHEGIAVQRTSEALYADFLNQHADDKDLPRQIELARTWLSERGLL